MKSKIPVFCCHAFDFQSITQTHIPIHIYIHGGLLFFMSIAIEFVNCHLIVARMNHHYSQAFTICNHFRNLRKLISIWRWKGEKMSKNKKRERERVEQKKSTQQFDSLFEAIEWIALFSWETATAQYQQLVPVTSGSCTALHNQLTLKIVIKLNWIFHNGP